MTRIMRLRPLLVAFLLVGILPSCATIVKGTTESISVASNPTNADVTVDGLSRGLTPLSLELRRKRDHLVTIQKEGYQPQSIPVFKSIGGAVWGNILAGGLIGWGVDAASGAQYNLDPTNINVNLVATTDESRGNEEALNPSTFIGQLNDLDELMDQGRITDEEYENMRTSIFREFYPEVDQ